MKGARLVHQVIAVALFRLLLNTARRFVYPFAPVLSRGLDVPLAAITTIIAGCQFTSLLGLFSGPLADRHGYRFAMRTGLALLAVGMLMCGLLDGYTPVFVGLVAASLGKTIFDPAIQAYIARRVPYARRGRVIGAVETAWAGSTLVGIPVLSLVIDRVGLQYSFLLLAALGTVSWLALAMIVPPDEGEDGPQRSGLSMAASLWQLLQVRPAAGMLFFGFWISVANDCLFVVYGVWFEQDFQVSIVTLGFSTIAIGGAELLGESLSALVSDRVGLKRSTIVGLCLAIAAYLMLPRLGLTLMLAMIGMFLIFLFYEFTIVTSFSLSTEVLPQGRATMMGGFYATAGLGRMLGVVVGGSVWALGGIALVCWVAAACTAVGLVSLVWGLRDWQQA